MLSKSDLIHIPYTPDLTSGGIAYACRSLPHTYNRMGGSSAKRMSRIVNGIAVELAFRRYLNENQIPFDVKGATPFTDPDKYDVSLGGHRCDVKSFLLSRKKQLGELNHDWGLLLGASALIPSDQFASGHRRESDIYIFSFLTGLLAVSQRDMTKAIDAGKPIHLIHTMPKEWAKPKYWQSLGELVLKSDCDEELIIELGGQDAERNFISKKIKLMPRKRQKIVLSLHTLVYVHIDKMPSGLIGIHSSQKGDVYLIPSNEWKNIWLYGMRVILAGYLTRKEFRQRAKELPVGSKVFQYSRTKTKNLTVPVRELRPLRQLFEQVKDWRKDEI